MEEKLAKYRAQNEKEAFINRNKEKIKTILSLPKLRSKKQSTEHEILINARLEEQETLIDDSVTNEEIELKEGDIKDDISCCTPIQLAYYLFWLLVWGTVYAIFIKLQFGTVYLIMSALLGIYFNTRTKPKRPNEISAYSVFNKNCESIDGTLKAEQFEREIRFGRGVLHV